MLPASFPTPASRFFRHDLPLAALCALLLSAFIYLQHWQMADRTLNTLFALGGLWLLLNLNARALWAAGFFIGLLWFYWIGFSFRYYGFEWAVPLVSLGFGAVYALYFGVMGLRSEPWARALILFGLSFVEPFDFNWMQPELPFVVSWLGVAKWQFALILAALSLVSQLRSPRRYWALVLLLGAFEPPSAPPPLPDLKIKLVATELPQALKWQPQMRRAIHAANFKAIDDAADEGYDLVVLPESMFVVFLNRHPDLIEKLQERSERIAIVTGALYEENGMNYNVTYLFDGGRVEMAKKVTLVPFGEYIPLPAFLRDWVNEAVFGGASDYMPADAPTDFVIRGTRFRNAVCYEATCDELFEGDPAYMIAISNNGWFTPSIEPTLQRLLMRYYARRHGTVIFHAANLGGTGIVE